MGRAVTSQTQSGKPVISPVFSLVNSRFHCFRRMCEDRQDHARSEEKNITVLQSIFNGEYILQAGVGHVFPISPLGFSQFRFPK